MLALSSSLSAALPTYLQEALATFNPEVPAGWAYTITTTQEQRRTIERFDPGKSPTAQWALLQIDGRSPDEKEFAQYQKYKAGQAPGAIRATYHKSDIEPFSLKLIHENQERAVFTGSFREQSADADKMLAHLRLRLVVNKSPAYVQQATIELIEPYSPVLTVKMNSLQASVEFSPPEEDRPSLPIASSSFFRGRIFFFGVQEDLRWTYRDFTPVAGPAR